MSIQLQLMLTDVSGKKKISFESLSATARWTQSPTSDSQDSPKRPGTKGIMSPSQIPHQSPSLTSVEQNWKHQGPEDSDFHSFAQVPMAKQKKAQKNFNWQK